MEFLSLGTIHDETLIYSKRPGKVGKLLNFFRKILWHAVRPFHFYQTEEFYRLLRQQNQEIQTLKNTINSFPTQLIIQTISQEASVSHNDLRVVSIPLNNRIRQLEEELEHMQYLLNQNYIPK